ncbi:hypothetical protein ACTXT7_012198 [Hymenolepis weldensis]
MSNTLDMVSDINMRGFAGSNTWTIIPDKPPSLSEHHYRDSSASGPTVEHVSSSSNTSDYATPCGGPSQRVSFETAAVVTTTTLEMPVNNSAQLNATSPLYEEPVNFIQRLSTIPASREESISGWSPEHRQLSHPQMGTQIRHSLSSQLEILLTDSGKVCQTLEEMYVYPE